MIDLEGKLTEIDAEIGTFEKSVAELREAEADQAELQGQLRESRSEETRILNDKTSDAQTVSGKLERQRALTATIESRLQAPGKHLQICYHLGGKAVRSFTLAANAFAAQHPLPAGDAFSPAAKNRCDHRWVEGDTAYIKSFSPTLSVDQRLARVSAAVELWSQSLRGRFQNLKADFELEQKAKQQIYGTLPEQPKQAAKREMARA